MRLTTARDQFIQERRFGTTNKRPLSATSLERYYWALTGFVDWLHRARGKDSVLLFTAAAAREFIEHRSDKVNRSAATLALECAALREFAKWGTKKRYWRAEDVEEMPAVLRPDAEPRPMPPAERNRVMTLPLHGQDAVLRALLYYSGCREAEILGIRLQHITPPHELPDGTVVLGKLHVWGKGAKSRVVDIHRALWAELVPYLTTLAGQPADRWLLQQSNGKPWSPRMVIDRARQWGELAGCAERLKPHRFRHSFATDTLEANPGDIRAVQVLLGHKQLTTTQRYTRVVDQRRAAVVASLPTFVQLPDSVRPGDGDAAVT